MSNALIRSVPSAPETPTFRAPPHNFEAEQALLGAILVNNEACDRVSSFLKADHFYDPLHGRIYDHAAKLIWAGKRATPITLKTFFQGDEPVGAPGPGHGLGHGPRAGPVVRRTRGARPSAAGRYMDLGWLHLEAAGTGPSPIGTRLGRRYLRSCRRFLDLGQCLAEIFILCGALLGLRHRPDRFGDLGHLLNLRGAGGIPTS